MTPTIDKAQSASHCRALQWPGPHTDTRSSQLCTERPSVLDRCHSRQKQVGRETSGERKQRTLGVVAAEFEEAVEDEAGAHGVADQDDWAVPVAARHQRVRQQHASLLRAIQRHHPSVIYHLHTPTKFFIIISVIIDISIITRFSCKEARCVLQTSCS